MLCIHSVALQSYAYIKDNKFTKQGNLMFWSPSPHIEYINSMLLDSVLCQCLVISQQAYMRKAVSIKMSKELTYTVTMAAAPPEIIVACCS